MSLAGTTAIIGPEGEGKSLISVFLMHQKYLMKGYPVATNMNIYLENLMPPLSRATVIRVPDYPTAQDIIDLGYATFNPDETENGGLFLDEVSVFMNAREWNEDKAYRKDLMAIFRQTLKRGWNKYFLSQGYDSFDSQIRKDLIKFVARCRRTDSLRIPLLGPLLGLFGLGGMLPKAHIVTVKSGAEKNAMVAARWKTMGKRYWGAYQRRQQYNPGSHWLHRYDTTRQTQTPHGIIQVQDYYYPSHQQECVGSYCLLSAWHLKGRYQNFWQRNEKYIKYVLTFFTVLFLIINIPTYITTYTKSKQIYEQKFAEPKPPSDFYSVVTGVITRSDDHFILQTPQGAIYAYSKQTFNGIDYYYDGQNYFAYHDTPNPKKGSFVTRMLSF